MCNYFLLSEKDCFLTHPAVIVEASYIPVCLIAFREDVSVLCFHFERFLKLAFCTSLKNPICSLPFPTVLCFLRDSLLHE